MAEIDLTVKRMGKREIESHIMEFLKPFYLKFKMRLDQIKLCETQRVELSGNKNCICLFLIPQ